MKYGFIALLTDYGLEDHFAGVLKGVIHRINPAVRTIDLTHHVPPQGVAQAGFLLKHSFRYFPERTVFLCVVDPGVGTERGLLAARKGSHLFLAPDNGLLSFLKEEKGACFYALKIPNPYVRHAVSDTFHGRDLLAPLAAHISRGIPLSRIALRTRDIRTLSQAEPAAEKNGLWGTVLYADHFGNLITNIPRELFFEFVKLKNRFVIRCGSCRVTRITNSYRIRERLGALFNSFGLLEIFAPDGNACKILKKAPGDRVKVSVF